MGAKAVDRTVRDVDVIEHVVKGVRAELRPRRDEVTHPQTQSSRLGGKVVSHVTVHVVPDEEPDKG